MKLLLPLSYEHPYWFPKAGSPFVLRTREEYFGISVAQEAHRHKQRGLVMYLPSTLGVNSPRYDGLIIISLFRNNCHWGIKM